MEHSPRYDKVKTYYDRDLWTESMVRDAVGRWITEAECSEILTGRQ